MKLWGKNSIFKAKKRKKNLHFYYLKVNTHLKYGAQSHYSYLI